MVLPAAEDIENMTPMMKQYFQLKSQCLDAILFFRMGDFFEVFGDDAQEISPQLNIVLTSRERGDKQRIHFCGVPHHSARSYWLRLLRKGYKIAIADQMEDASFAKSLVKREIVKIISPGCIDELEGLDADTPNYILAAYEHPGSRLWSVALADISTGEFLLAQLKTLKEVEKVIWTHKPREVLIRSFFKKEFERINDKRIEDKFFISLFDEGLLNDSKEQKKICVQVFGEKGLVNLLSSVKGGFEVAGATLYHFLSLHIGFEQFSCIKPLFEKDTIVLDEIVIRDLELLETSRSRKKEGSLFCQINYTVTPMGSRLLKKSLIRPLCSLVRIKRRHEDVAQVISLGKEFSISLRENLNHLGDLERLSARIAGRSVRPNEVAKVKEALLSLKCIHKLLISQVQEKNSAILDEFLSKIVVYADILSVLDCSVKESPDSLGKGDGVFIPGFDQQLDQHLDLSRGGQKKVEAYQEDLRKQTKISNLKIKRHKTYGLLIEVTKANLMKVPDGFVRRQTMVNYERFATSRLKELEESLVVAQDLAIQREQELYELLLDDLVKKVSSLQTLATHIAYFDLIFSYAWLAMECHYCQPTIHKDNRIELKNARHPVVEAYVGSHHFVANDVILDHQAKQMIITGPNMAGKSTVMRLTALCVILSQMGAFVPADKAELPLFDNIFTRIGASDDLSRGLSTFMVEMQEASHILRHAGQHSLVILDEVGRGTSTKEGLAIAAAILEYISTKLNAWTLFATHYHEIVSMFVESPCIINYKTEVVEKEASIKFTYKLIKGFAGHSFGLEVAKLAGFPAIVLERAKCLIKPQGSLPLERKEDKLFVQKKSSLKSQEIMSRLERININRTSPMQAFQYLNDFILIQQKNPKESLFHDGQDFF